MKILIVYDTYYGNTQKVAEMMKAALGEERAEVLRVDVLTQDKIDQANVLCIGSPTRAFNMTKKVKKALKKYHFKETPFFAFDTRANTADVEQKFLLKMIDRFGYAAEKIARRLEKKGAKRLLEPVGYFVKDTEGPLYEEVAAKIQEDMKHLMDAMTD